MSENAEAKFHKTGDAKFTEGHYEKLTKEFQGYVNDLKCEMLHEVAERNFDDAYILAIQAQEAEHWIECFRARVLDQTGGLSVDLDSSDDS